MDLRNQSINLHQRKKEIEETKVESEELKPPMEVKEEGILTKLSLPTTTSSSPCSSPSHEFSFTISFHSPSAAKSPSALSRCSAFDLAPADDIFFHGHLLPLQILSRPPPTSSPRSSRSSQQGAVPAGPQERDGGESHGDAADAVSSTNSSSSSSAASGGNGDAKERSKNKFLSSLFTGKWRKASEAGEREEEEEEEKKRKRRAFDAMSRLLRRYVSAVEPLFSFRGGRGRRGEPLRRRPYSFAGNPSAGAAAGRREEWRRRRGELSAPASMRTSPSNSGLLVAPASSAGGSSEESTMEELRSAIEAAIAHCKSSVAMKEEKCKC